MSTKPLNIISIIIATYNRAHLIPDTLNSIKNQTFQHFECLIIDDGSTDDTANIVETCVKQDTRFQYLKRPKNYKKGLPGCRNFGLDLCKGNYVIFFDDDDLVHPMCLKTCLDVLSDSFDFCAYQKQSFQDSNFKIANIAESPKIISHIGAKNLIEILENKIPLASCTVMWKKYCFTSDRFLEHLQYAEEWELYSRLITSGCKGVLIDNILYFNRKHAKSNTHEYYSGNPERRKSKSDAILAIALNLKEKNILNFKLKRYLLNQAFSIKDHQLFQSLKQIFDSSLLENFLLKLYYLMYPLRIQFFRLRKIFS